MGRPCEFAMGMTMELEETQLANGMFRWAPKDVEKPRTLQAFEANAFHDKKNLLHQKAAALRDAQCWAYECTRRPHVWVVEVSYDFKGDKAAPEQHAAISSASYDGPVPGFCLGHLGDGPRELAEVVFFNKPEMFWGVRPNRWFVSFTDGTRQGGMCVEFDPKTQVLPQIMEEFIAR